MKILIAITLVLLVKPVVAQSFGLYDKSGGYETSSGYERSGGYEKSEGYWTSEGYETSDEGYKQSEEAYQRFQIEKPYISKRINAEYYDEQIYKSKQQKGKWIAERHQNDRVAPELRDEMDGSGGVEGGIIDYYGIANE